FGRNFNCPINIFPINLIHLEFRLKFNQQIDESRLPKNISHLIFGDKYNKLIDMSQLPTSLVYLELGKFFNAPLIGRPKQLKLSINKNYKYMKAIKSMQ